MKALWSLHLGLSWEYGENKVISDAFRRKTGWECWWPEAKQALYVSDAQLDALVSLARWQKRGKISAIMCKNQLWLTNRIWSDSLRVALKLIKCVFIIKPYQRYKSVNCVTSKKKSEHQENVVPSYNLKNSFQYARFNYADVHLNILKAELVDLIYSQLT